MSNNFHFIRPELLWLVLILILILIFTELIYPFIAKTITQKNLANNNFSNWAKICSPKILDYLYFKKNKTLKKSTGFLIYLISFLIIISLAGPTWSKKETRLYKNQNAWIIGLSLSDTIENTDLPPSRLQRAKYKIKDFLNYIHDDQLALIIYTNKAFDLIPLTSDKKTIEHILPSIDPLIMPVRGNDINSVLIKAEKLIDNIKLKYSSIILFTDSDANSSSLLNAKKLGEKNVNINIINLNKAKSISSLSELSTLSNGIYQNITNDDQDLKNIINHVNLTYKLAYEQDKLALGSEIWHDMGPWLLLFILPLLLMYLAKARFNNNYSSIIIILMSIILINSPIENIYANTTSQTNPSLNKNNLLENLWQKLWYNNQQITAEKLNTHYNNNINPIIFTNSKWQAAAEYNNKNYAKTEELLAKNLQDQTSLYNYANSLAQQGKIQPAIDQYNKILHANPNNHDAKFNKELLENYQAKKNKPDKKQDNKQDNKQKKPDQNQSQDQSPDKNQDENNKPPKNNQNQQNQQNNSNSSENNQEPKNQQETEQQAKSDKELEKWLNKIPDNPAIYLRNQLQYEYWQEQQN